MAIKNAKRPDVREFPDDLIRELQPFWIKSDAINSTDSTGELELFSLPAGTMILDLGYNLLTAWGDSEPTNVQIWLGSTADYRLYGELGMAQLSSTSPGVGQWAVNYESTGESKVVAYIASQGVIPVAPTAGSVEIWLSYRANSEADRWLRST